MNLRQLKYFVEVVDAGSMNRAAEQLHVAQPALSMQIGQLEEELGVVLLTRHSRGVEPTRAGALLHDRALAILKLVEETGRDVAACDREGIESVRLGMTPTLMLVVGPDLAIHVRDHVAGLHLALSEAMSHVLVDSLLRGDIDLALAYDVPDLPELTRTALFQEDLVFVSPLGVVRGDEIAFAEAMDEGLALPEERDTVRELVFRTARDLGIAPKVTFEVRSIAAIKDLVMRGAACAVLPYGSVARERADGKVSVQRIVRPAIRRTLYIAAASRRARFRSEPGLVAALRSTVSRLTQLVGPLARPIDAPASGLSVR